MINKKLTYQKNRALLTSFLAGGLIIIHLWLLTNIRFTAWPEMLSYPYLIKHGYSFYGDIIHPFVPLLPVVLTYVYRLFGLSVMTLKGFTLILILLTDLILYAVSYRLFGKTVAIVTMFTYAIIQTAFEGNGMWFDLAVTPLIVVASYMTYQWLYEKKTKNSIYTGVLLGLAMLIKLSAVWVIGGIGVLWVLRGLKEKILKKTIVFFAIILTLSTLLVVATLFYIYPLGKLSDFLFWGVIYPLFYVARMSGYLEPPSLRQIMIVGGISLPILTRALMLTRRFGGVGNSDKKKILLLIVFFGCSLLFALHRFAFFHLQPALPFLAVLLSYSLVDKRASYGIGVQCSWLRLSAIGSMLFLAIVATKILYKDWRQPDRFLEPEVIQSAKQLSEIIPADEPVFFYNVPSQYFVLAGLLPTKPWADTFPWYLEFPGLQQMIIDVLEMQHSKWVVSAPFSSGDEYALGSYRPETIGLYIREHFKPYTQIDSIHVLRRIL